MCLCLTSDLKGPAIRFLGVEKIEHVFSRTVPILCMKTYDTVSTVSNITVGQPAKKKKHAEQSWKGVQNARQNARMSCC